jgi:hypothetical protein
MSSRAPRLVASLAMLTLAACSAAPVAPTPSVRAAPTHSHARASHHHRRRHARHHVRRPVAQSLCGAPSNPYGLNLCGRGSLVYNPPSNVCNYFNCIANFPNGVGYMVECNDGTYSMSGGRPGACSGHDGEGTAVTRG